MNLDKAVLRFAGFVVIVSVVLTILINPYWILLTTFAGINMIQASYTGFCPAALLFKRIGIQSGKAFD